MLHQNEYRNKRIEDMLWVVNKNVKKLTKESITVEKGNEKKKVKIDTIVNSASPDLMGGKKKTVDRALHKAIDKRLKHEKGCSFNQMICKELSTGTDSISEGNEEIVPRIRCPRGKAVITGGYGFCTYVIHAVGTRFKFGDIRRSKEVKLRGDKYCSSSVQILESCYHEIVRLIRKYPDIKNVAVPIIGAGNYKVDFDIAARIAVSAIGNALMDWKRSDLESFNTSGIENIVFFVKKENEGNQKEKISDIISEYGEIYQEDHQVVFQNSFKAQNQYYNEIRVYDENRGYFAIAAWFRRTLVRSRMFFGWVSNKIKDGIGGIDWQKRRKAVEKVAVFKLFIPALGIVLVRLCPCIKESLAVHVLSFLVFYSMADTVTYLLALIMMADIQKPSANVIRSLLLLFFNYVEVSLGIAYFYYVYHIGGAKIREALAFSAFGEGAEMAANFDVPDMILRYTNTGLQFFFLTMVFGYLVQHMRQRKFRGEKLL